MSASISGINEVGSATDDSSPDTTPDSDNSPPVTSPTPSTPSAPLNPAIAITTYPSYINAANLSNYDISGTCTDVTGIDIKLNTFVMSTVSCSAGSWSASINATSIADGSVTLSVSQTSSTTDLDSKSINKDISLPVAPASIEDGDQVVSTTYSSWITWSASSDIGSGLAKYQLRIVDSGNSEVIPWTDMSLLLGYGFTGLSLSEGSTYKAEVRALDNAGNASSVTQGDGWYVVPQGWKQQAYLKAPNAETGDSFGYAVAISGDTVIVGVTGEDSNQTTITNGTSASADNSAIAAGASYVFKRTGNTWAQEAYLKAPNAESGDGFGNSVAISEDTVVVGVPTEDSNQTTITNGTTASSDNSAVGSGAAYVFKRTGNTWTQEAYLKAPNSETGDTFGISVAISKNTIVVGSQYEDSSQTTITNGSTASADNLTDGAGAAYVFKRTGSTWAQEAYLKAPNAETSDWFGTSVAISGDTVIVGAHLEDSNQTTITNGTTASTDNSANSSGAAYVFKRTGSTWAQEAYLKAPNAETGDQFGYSVSISEDTIVVGANWEDSNQTTITNGTTASADNSASFSGAAYVFKRTGNTWAQEAFLKSSNMEAGDFFSWSTSISGDTIVIGAKNEDSNQTTITNGATASSDNSSLQSGAAYVFKRTGNTWAQEAYLKAPNAETGDLFGSSVAISKDTIVVGSYQEDSNQTTITNGTTASADNSALAAGAAYVFNVDRTANWQQQAYIKAPNAESGDMFGNSIGISGDTIVVGAYNEDSSQTTITNGTTASSDNSSIGTGAAYVFKRTGNTWAQEAYLKASNANSSDIFGYSLAISGYTITVGAPFESSNQTTITNGTTASADNSAGFAGAAYVFKRTGNTWAQEAYLKAPNANLADYFGWSVGISGDTIVVGTWQEDSNQTTITNGTTASANDSAVNSGAAYVFKRTGNTWAQEAYLKAPNAETSDAFGIVVAISGDTIAIGATGEDSSQTTITNGTTASADNSVINSGSAYVFKRTGNTWAQEAYLKAPNAEADDNFGSSVAISGDTIVVGTLNEDSSQTTITNGTTASSDNSAAGSGAAYVFKRSGNTWAQEAYLKAPNAETGDNFSNSISISGDTIVIGANLEDSNQTTITNGTTASSDNSAAGSGAAYIFKR